MTAPSLSIAANLTASLRQPLYYDRRLEEQVDYLDCGAALSRFGCSIRSWSSTAEHSSRFGFVGLFSATQGLVALMTEVIREAAAPVNVSVHDLSLRALETLPDRARRSAREAV